MRPFGHFGAARAAVACPLSLAAAMALGCASSSKETPPLEDGREPPPPPKMWMPPPPPPAGPTGMNPSHSNAAEPRPPAEAPEQEVGTLRQVFPAVRASAGGGIVEFDATVAAQAHDPASPHVYLELVACTPDTREHESLVVTPARPSHVHAAMLLAGFTPGAPVSWTFENNRLVASPPTGDGVQIEFLWRDGSSGRDRSATPENWIVNVRDGRALPEAEAGWIFAGSAIVRRQGREHYDADASGTLVGLASFGGETIAWRTVFSPEADVDAPEWIANRAAIPAFGTPVRVRISSAALRP